MMIKHIAVSAAMAIFAGTMIGGAGPAQADPIRYTKAWPFYMVAPNLQTDGPVYLVVQFITSPSGASVRAYNIYIENWSSHEIVVDVDRWQAADGDPAYRGPSYDINADTTNGSWAPTEYISFTEDPLVYVHVQAVSRPGMEGGIAVPAKPARDDFYQDGSQ